MKSFGIREAVNVVGGRFTGSEKKLDNAISGVVIDSRKVTGGEMYVALIGERLDGHDFVTSAIQNGASCALVSREIEGVPCILVTDTVEAFQKLAAWYKGMFSAKTVGISGSVGKTSTKEMVSAVLSEAFETLKSEGNLNNQTGVPQNLFRIEDSTQAAVIEMGTNHFGEIDALARMVCPDICLLTNIGVAHIEYLGSREGILKAKSEMFPYMKEGGTIFVNGDDDMLITLKKSRSDVKTYGLSEECDIRAENVTSMGLDGSLFTVNGENFEISAPGVHMVYNALAAYGVAKELGMSDEQIRRGYAKYQAPMGRMMIEKANEITVLNDVYNASPSSVKASLDILAYATGRKVAILGDMLELGENSADYHFEVGSYAKTKGVDMLLAVGKDAKHIADGYGQGADYFCNQKSLLEGLKEIIKRGDTILVKASHGMHLEKTVETLKNIAIF